MLSQNLLPAFSPPASVNSVRLKDVAMRCAPLMMASLSASLMLFFDKIILARYSIEAMEAVVTLGLLTSLFQFAAMSIVSIAEVFVGQHNGAQQYKRIGETIWQMLWFSGFTLCLFLPLALFAGKLLMPSLYYDTGLTYYRIMMGLGFVYPAYSAMVAFYMGQGNTQLLMWVAVAANLLNIVLDMVLIHGLEGWIPPLGITGAGIATIFSQSIQFLFLFFLFLRPKNQEDYGTNRYKFKPKLLKKYLTLGLPSAVGGMVDSTAWVLSMYMLTLAGPVYITVAAMGQTVYALFSFANESLQRAVISYSSNIIGANMTDHTPNLLKSALNLQWLMAVFLLFPLVLFPEVVMNLFVLKEFTPIELVHVQAHIKDVLLLVWFYFLIDGNVWILGGILVSGGDTRFTMLTSSINSWLFALLPIYLLVTSESISPIGPWKIFIGYSCMNLAVFYLRYTKAKWRKQLIDQDEEPVSAT